MKNKIITKRYAQTLLLIAEENNATADFVEGLTIIENEVNISPMVQYAWFKDQLTREEKKAVVTKFLEKRIHPLLLNFLNLLVDKGREEYLLEIIKEFRNTANEQTGMLDVKVGTAFELSDDERERLRNALSKVTGRDVHVEHEVVPEIIGGVVLKINDKVFDSSVLKRLSLLQRELKGKPSFDDNYLKSFVSKPEEPKDTTRADLVAEVSSSIELPDEKVKKIEAVLSEKMGRSIVVHTKIDPSLIGGLTIKIGDKIIDGSVKQQLNLLEKDISKVLENWGEGLK